MESGQCMEDGDTITQELCLPSYEQITKHIMTVAKKTGVHHIFIASDVGPRLSYIKKKLGNTVSNHFSGVFVQVTRYPAYNYVGRPHLPMQQQH